jgi:hypothetical protein
MSIAHYTLLMTAPRSGGCRDRYGLEIPECTGSFLHVHITVPASINNLEPHIINLTHLIVASLEVYSAISISAQ